MTVTATSLADAAVTAYELMRALMSLTGSYLCREEAAGGAPERICRCRTRALALRFVAPSVSAL